MLKAILKCKGLTRLAPVVSPIKRIGKINPEEIGLILKDGSIQFGKQEQAVKYMAKRCSASVKGLNPFEREIGIEGRRIVGEADGTLTHAKLTVDAEIKGHSHPSTYANGCTTAPSLQDYSCFIEDSNCKRMFVFNSNGEYYTLEKIPGFDYSKINMEEVVKQHLLTLYSNAPREQYEWLKSIADNPDYLEMFVAQHMPSVPQEIPKSIVDNTHKFWVKFGKQLGVKTKTNFSNFVNETTNNINLLG